MRRSRYSFLIAIGLLATSAACSLILDHDTEQCSTDGDCKGYAAGAVCRDSVCVSGSAAGGDAEAGGPNAERGADADAAVEAGPCQKGGFAGDPTTNAEFLNHCTSAQCEPFDNCDKLGLCGA